MAAGDKPRFKVVLKRKAGIEKVDLIAIWDNKGKLSATLSRSIVELALKLENGAIVRVKHGADGKPDHWINVYEEIPKSMGKTASVKCDDDDSDNDDDITF